ncbi:ABC transporter [Paractinoplanes durhamensis]|uniref:ABC transporter n=2 Tax=Paractinoplanes durhamensis TaxID=113563 RepID=A0ABQ3Z6P3_9ACTN|nr:ABC transporter [Actinoplanes durhamensis]
MIGMAYAMTVRVAGSFPETVARVRDALKDQGFGVLTEIDVQATLREKLGEQMEDYLILGACNPPLAHRALGIDREIGLLLPCNVVVRSDGPGTTLVQALDPQTMVQITGRPELKEVADDAAARLQAALATLGG